MTEPMFIIHPLTSVVHSPEPTDSPPLTHTKAANNANKARDNKARQLGGGGVPRLYHSRWSFSICQELGVNVKSVKNLIRHDY
ncbi:hypothetical protein AOLI_G00067090 [Acnodon oligacanthus]